MEERFVIDARPEAVESKTADQCSIVVDGRTFVLPRETAETLCDLLFALDGGSGRATPLRVLN